MPTRWKIPKPLRVALYVLECLLALALAVLIILSSGWFQHWLERRVITGLEDLTGGRVELARFRFRPWVFEVTLQNLAIHGSEPAGDLPLVSARNVVAHLSPEQFLLRHLRLRSLDVDDLRVHLRTGPDGATNLPGPRQQLSAERSLVDLMDLSIGRLTVSHSAIVWNNQPQPFELDTRELAVLLRMTRGRYTGTLSSSATTIRSARGSLPPVTFNSRFELTRAGLVVSSFAWQAPGMMGRASFTVRPLATPEAYASFQVSADLPALNRIFLVRELPAGSLQIEGQAIYRHGELYAQGRARARQVAVHSPTFSSERLDATADYALEKGQLNLTNLIVSAWGGTAQGTLQANLGDSPASFRLKAQVHQVRLEDALSSTAPGPLLAAELHLAAAIDGTVNATWSGRLERLKTTFDLTFHGPAGAPRNQLPVSGCARGTLGEERGLTLHLAKAEFQTPHSTVTAQGTLQEPASLSGAAQPLTLTIATADFEEWRPLFQTLMATSESIPLALESPAEFSGQLTGTYNQPSMQGRLKMGQFRYHGWVWDRLAAAIALGPGFAQISSGRVEHQGSSLELNASAQLDHWRLTPNSAVRFSAQAQRTPLEGLKAAIAPDFPARGLVTGRVDLDGTASSLAGTGVLRIDNGAIGDEPFDSLSAQLRVEQSLWKLEGIQLAKGHGRLSGDLALEPTRRFVSGQLRGVDFRLADIKHFPLAAATVFPEGALDGRLSFEVRGQGTPDSFHVLGGWHIDSLRVAGTPLGDLNGAMVGEGQQLRIEGEDQGPAGTLHLWARTTASGDWPFEAEGEYSGLRVDPWIRAFFSHEFDAAVTVGGSFQGAGHLRTPAKIDLHAQARDLAVNFPSIQWKNDQPIALTYSAGTLAVSRFVMRGPSTELAIEGAVRFGERVTLALNAQGQADATLLTALDPNLQATGGSALRVRLTGTPARPILNGTLDVQDVSLGYGGLPFRFNNLQGTIQLEGERAVIRSLRGISGGGTINLGGFLTLQENPRFELRADLDQVRVRYPPSFTSVLNGNLRLAGNSERGQLQGELVVRQMFLNENVNWISRIIESTNPFAEQPGAATQPLASRINLNVRVTSAPSVRVETPDLRVMGDIDIRVQGTVANPVQVGSIHFLSGEGVFRGNRYTLVRGDISLTNPFRTQAYVDLEAQTHVERYELKVDISGPFDRLKFAYRSDPPLPTADIFSLLALGYARQEEVFSTASANPLRTVGASALLSEALSSQVTGRIQHLFGVSRIKIDPNVGVPGFGSGARVTVEQQVTRDLTLTYVTNTSSSQYRIIQFELAVSDNVSVLGIRDQNGIFGLEFRFRHRFK
ncbi:MAG: translocation/assembly module TamB domain-containing protein [Terriglobia bacterium]